MTSHKTRTALLAVALAALTLSACGNTAQGLKRDGQDQSRAMDDASRRVLGGG
ncbi:entericidin [Rhizobium sp. CC-YZS058]|uniref:entericidin n=1 Tax=Rhizobium sp. CC-YZS058 TaxID=3042153 RepID=UPI002B0527BA|nr:entericidin [Rhizobium sp. CC-YZS058]MEA3534577.1 entericidin [Rhizobium sp. CC-YZS058]